MNALYGNTLMLPNRKQLRIIVSMAPLVLRFGPTLLRKIAPFPYSAGNRQLNAAILRNDTPGVKAALTAGADPNTEVEGWEWTDGVHPLTAAMQGDIHRHLRDTPLLLTMDSLVPRNPIDNHTTRDQVPIENLETIKALVEAGADVNARSFIGCTPLYQAAEWDYSGTALYLLDHGADPNIQSCGGEVPCSEAATHGNVFLLKALLDRGANPNTPDIIGDTALHMATLGRDTPEQAECVRILLQHGANPRVKNEDGRTPLELAKKNGNPGLVKALEQVK